jgi:ABC-type nitrate/sulfonate/bicarbonate transport system permease component
MALFNDKNQLIIKKSLIQLAGVLALIAFWQYLANELSNMILASPSQTFSRLSELICF